MFWVSTSAFGPDEKHPKATTATTATKNFLKLNEKLLINRMQFATFYVRQMHAARSEMITNF